jgi:hypothetical protein
MEQVYVMLGVLVIVTTVGLIGIFGGRKKATPAH